jgi:polyisoprenoid-binding protein YceI
MSIEHWEIASTSEIHFTVRHLLISKVRGQFSRWSGTLLAPDGDWSRATVEIVIDASSIDTGIAKRDTDLRSANFLDVERYPDITFRSLGVTAEQVGRLRVAGELTMKGRVGEVPLEVESRGVTLDRSGSERAEFSARAAIRRRDFGASGNLAWDSYGVMIGERIDIEIDVEAVRQATAAVSFSSDIHDLTASEG